MNLSYCILAEAVKKEIEALGSHIQVRTFPSAILKAKMEIMP
jgi:hypothetical protein